MASTTDLLVGVGVVVFAAIALGLTQLGAARGAVADVRDTTEELVQQAPTGAARIRALNESLSVLQAGAGTDVSEAFTADLASPGGTISSVDESVMGGGNPETASVVTTTSEADESSSVETYDVSGVDVGGGSFSGSFSVGAGGDVSSIGDITV